MKLANLVLMLSLMVTGCGRDTSKFHRPYMEIPAVLDLTNGSVFRMHESWYSVSELTITFLMTNPENGGWCNLIIHPATLERRDGGFVIDRSVFNANGSGPCGSGVKTTWQASMPAKVYYSWYFRYQRGDVHVDQMNDIEIID